MASPLRPVLSASALLAAVLLVAGCTASPGETPPTSGTSPDDSGQSSSPAADDDIEAAWLDDGRMFAIVTTGSSTCVPMIDEVSAEGQRVAVSLVDPPSGDDTEKVCTTDLAQRASLGALPEGVDPSQDVEFIVTIGDITEDAELDGNSDLTTTPDDVTKAAPSAGWFDDDGIVLLTWGSSTCPPVAEGVEAQKGGATITFDTEDKVCTMDMAPRATVLGLPNNGDDDRDDADFTLTLVGGGLDGTVDVLRG